MQLPDSFSQNVILSVPWKLDARDEDLDLEVHGGGCGCSCSCSCDDEGGLSSGDSGSEAGSSLTAGPSAGDIAQCAFDAACHALEESPEELAVAGLVSAYAGTAGVAAAAGTVVAATMPGAAMDGAQASAACKQVAEDTREMIAGTAEFLSSSEGFKKAVTTIMAAH